MYYPKALILYVLLVSWLLWTCPVRLGWLHHDRLACVRSIYRIFWDPPVHYTTKDAMRMHKPTESREHPF
jgi:hypothetical protein